MGPSMDFSMDFSMDSTRMYLQATIDDDAQSMDSDSSPAGEPLVDRLLRNLVKSSFDKKKEFWPHGCIEQIVTHETILEELESSSLVSRRAEQADQVNLSELVDFFLHGSRALFAIVLCCNIQGDRLFRVRKQFKKLKLKDSSLPIVEDDVKRIFYSSSGSVRSPWNGPSVRNFCEYQWKAVAPVFDNNTREWKLHSDDVLPFTRASRRGSSGTFGEVHKVVIHPSHQINGSQVILSRYLSGLSENTDM